MTMLSRPMSAVPGRAAAWARRRWYVVVAAALSVAAVLVWLWWPESPPPATPRARQYLAFTACLLTDERGVDGSEAAPVWAGMQDASLATRAKVQYQQVTGPQTRENALPYLAGMAQRHCDVVLAVGSAPVSAVSAAAGSFPAVRFVVVGGGQPGANVTGIPVSSPDAVRAAVRDVIEAQIRKSPGR